MSPTTTPSHALQAALEAHPGLSGIHLLSDPLEAFALRIQLIETARQSVDLQYYIWANDTTGRYMLDAVQRAAARGVRVRLLLDDYGCLGADALFSALDMHPLIEIRLFNPLLSRRLKWTGYITNFSRIHRRMHNKAFTVDRQITIVGGRNIGDAYFDGAGENSFVDLDALAVGPVAQEVAEDFERYWESSPSYPAADFLPAVDEERRQQLLTELGQHDTPDADHYRRVIADSPLLADILAGRTALTWAPVTMISDDPAKINEKRSANTPMNQQLLLALGEPRQRVSLVSPYLIPMPSGVALFRDLVAKGVDVSLLTNSLASSDVVLIHIAYGRYRKALARAGVKLLEMKARDSGAASSDIARPSSGRLRDKVFQGGGSKTKHGIRASKGHGSKSGIMGSKSSSLHAKTCAVDSRKLFVGSFNFDPRSAVHNTELGFIIDSPPLAMRLEEYFDTVAREVCYRVSLSERGKLCWDEQTDDGSVRHVCEPKTTFSTRLLNRCYSLMPFDSFL